MDYYFKNANLILEGIKGDFAVEKGKLHFHGLKDPERYDQVTDLQGRIVLKGFCDLHTHLDKALVSSRVENRSGTLKEAIAVMGPYKAGMTEEDICGRAREALLMCWSKGTRYLRTHVDVDEQTGSRGVLALKRLQREFAGRVEIQIVAFPQEGLVNRPGNIRALDQALADGAELVGGIPAADQNPREHIDMVFTLAQKYNVDVDMHIDETDRAECMTLELLADATVRMGWQGRVTAGHCCSLAANPPERAGEVLRKVRNAGVRIVSLPSTNLYLQGRGDSYNVRRGIAPIGRISREFQIPTAVASDNIRDVFNPFGNGNLPEEALIAAHGCHMGGTEGLGLLFDMISRQPMEMFGVNPYLREGDEARFIICDARTAAEVIVGHEKLFGNFTNNRMEV